MLPAIVPVQAEIDLHKRTPLRPLRLADEMQPRFLRCVVRFLRVALDARANNVLPGRRPAAVAGDDMVQVQIFALKNPAAILARVLVPLKNVMPRELHFLLRHSIVNQKQDNARNADAKRNRVDGLVLRRILRKIAPLIEIESAERPVLCVHDCLGLALKKQSQRAAGSADIDGLPQPVQHKNMLI